MNLKRWSCALVRDLTNIVTNTATGNVTCVLEEELAFSYRIFATRSEGDPFLFYEPNGYRKNQRPIALTECKCTIK